MKIVRPKSRQRIPKNAKLVFRGVLFDVWQWRQKMFDGSYETFEKLKRPDTVQIIPVTKDKKIITIELLQPGRKPLLRVPAGRIDKDEDVVVAAQRELEEETGYKSGKMSLWYSVQPVSKIEWAVYTFVAKDLVKVGKPEDGEGEKVKLKLVSYDKFIRLAVEKKIAGSETALRVLEARLNSKEEKKLKQLLCTQRSLA